MKGCGEGTERSEVPSGAFLGEIKKVYLAGPMRGYPLFNFPAFLLAAQELRANGIEVLNPAEMDLEQDGWRTMIGEGVHPISHYIVRDIEAVCEADAIVVLSDWQVSAGALAECFVGAMWAKKPIFRWPSGERVTRIELQYALDKRMKTEKPGDPF